LRIQIGGRRIGIINEMQCGNGRSVVLILDRDCHNSGYIITENIERSSLGTGANAGDRRLKENDRL
jgi:hypothetical protein